MKILRLTIYLLAIVLAGCSSPEDPTPESSEAVLHINIGIPGAAARAARASEDAVTDVAVMLFIPYDADHPAVPGTLWKVLEATEIENTAEGRYTFDIKYNIDPATAPERLSVVTLANAAAHLSEIQALEGRTYTEIQRELTGSGDSTMWGIASAPIETAVRAQGVKVSLLRDWAKVSVTLSDEAIGDAGHTLGALTIYNRCDVASLMPRINADGTAILPSIPVNAYRTELPASEEYNASTISTTLHEQNILMGSADGNPADENQFERPAVIVGLRWKGGDKMYYYRLDFTDNGLLTDVMRNHHYVFNITAVNGPGSETPAEAYNTLTANVDATLTPWEDIDNDVALDGDNWISIPRQVTVGPEAGAEASVTFATNVEPDMWELKWTQEDVPFEYILPADATSPLKIKARSALPEGAESRTAQLQLNVTPRLRLVINVTQSRTTASGNGDQTDWNHQNIYGEV